MITIIEGYMRNECHIRLIFTMGEEGIADLSEYY